MPKRAHEKNRREKRPYCARCGRYLVGGADGYCPSRHNATKEEVLEECKRFVVSYPVDSVERTKIEQQIKRLEKHNVKED